MTKFKFLLIAFLAGFILGISIHWGIIAVEKRRLIVSQPEVTRENMASILLNEKTTFDENLDALIDYLETKGVRIIEKKEGG